MDSTQLLVSRQFSQMQSVVLTPPCLISNQGPSLALHIRCHQSGAWMIMSYHLASSGSTRIFSKVSTQDLASLMRSLRTKILWPQAIVSAINLQTAGNLHSWGKGAYPKITARLPTNNSVSTSQTWIPHLPKVIPRVFKVAFKSLSL